MLENLRKLLMGLAFAGALGCPGPKPPTPPTPTPPPPPTGVPAKGVPVKPEMLLRQENAKLKGVQAFMAVPCCMTFKVNGVETNSRWPSASKEFMDYTHQFGANFFHFRLGPYFGDATHESEWKDIGGPYVGNGPEWNQPWWDYNRELVYYALEQGSFVEINGIDTWYCKHAQWGDQQIPWPDQDVQACGRYPSPEQERYLKKMVEEFGCFGNVIWLDGNEAGEIQGYRPEWTIWLRDVIRGAEATTGCGFVHMIGTNSDNEVAQGSVDYVVTHDRVPLSGPIAGRWTLNNERNPEFQPDQEAALFKQARDAGQAWAAWRAGMSDTAFEETLSRMRDVVLGGGTPVGCFAPDSEDPKWKAGPSAESRPSQTLSWLREAEAVVGDRTGKPPLETLSLLATELRRAGHCATGPWTDAVVIKAPDGFYEEQHAVGFTDGGYTGSPYKNVWIYQGDQPTIGQCTAPTPPTPVGTFGCNWHNGWWDCSPQVVRNCEYCASIGMGEYNGNIRCSCPMRNECPGYKCEERIPCESYAMGGYATWKGDGNVEVNNSNALHLQARCANCTTLEVCDALGQNCKKVI